VPYITIHAQRKARAIWKLVHSIELTDGLFLDSAADDNNGDGLNGNNGVNGNKGDGGNNGPGKLNKATTEEDDIDSEDEVDDEGEELLIEGGAGSASLVSFCSLCV